MGNNMIVLSGLLFFACPKQPEQAPVAVETVVAVAEDVNPAVPAEAEKDFLVEGTAFYMHPSTKVGFVGSKVTKSHTGEFKTMSGTASVSGGYLDFLEVEIDMTSVETDHPKLTEHLKTADFFDVSQFAVAKFVADDIGAGLITGTLDFHGIQQELSFPADISIHENSVTIKAEFSLNRQLWEVSYPGRQDDLIKDEVLVSVDAKFGE